MTAMNGISYSPDRPVLNSRSTYTKTMLWIMASFLSATAGFFLIGPLIPASMTRMVSLAVIAVLILTSFAKGLQRRISGPLAIIIPALIGATLFPVITLYLSAGMGSTILMALAGTAVVFGSAAVFGWFSKANINSWSKPLFGILLGVIAVSLLNVFVFHLSVLSLILSIGTLVIFTIYSFIDIQLVRDADRYGVKPSSLALNIFLDIVNIFTSLLNILGFVNRS